MRVYFDNAATTPISEEVIAAMTVVLREQFGNPSSIHREGRTVRALLEEARRTVARCIGASTGEIFFTSGGTEANNTAIKQAVRDLGVTRIISSPTEHHCGLHSIESMEKYRGTEVIYLPVNAKGQPDLNRLEEILASPPSGGPVGATLVSLMHANNEIGTLLDLQKVSEICQANGAFFHTDTVQTIGHFPIDLTKMHVDFLSGAAHKFHGPKGVGFLYINSKNRVKPLIDGGSQERNQRGGTENVYGIVGLAKALELASANLETRREHIESVRNYLKMRLLDEFEDISFNGDFDGDFLYTILSVSFPPSAKNELLLLNLDVHGVACSGGSACTSGSEKGSHVLEAIDFDPLRKAIRFSFSHYSTTAEVDFLIEKLKGIVAVKRELTIA